MDFPEGTEFKSVAQEFDDIVDTYTGIMEDMVPHYRQLIISMFQFLPRGFLPERVIDLGCGNGNVTAFFMNCFPKASFHLVDASAEMLEQCRRRFPGAKITLEQNLFQQLELPENAYDLALAGFTFHHLEAQEKSDIFYMLHKSLRKGGILSSADLMVNKDSDSHDRVLHEWHSFAISNGRSKEDWDWVMDHYQKYDRPHDFEDQKQWLLEAGFKEVQRSWHDGHWVCLHALN